MQLRALALVLSVSLPLTVQAGGYGKATWGMTLAGVQKLFPGGMVAPPEGDETGYLAPHKFQRLSAACYFRFDRDRLGHVQLMFPSQAHPFTPEKDPDLIDPTASEAKEMFASIYAGLVNKYGEPKEKTVVAGSTALPGAGTYVWYTDKGETVIVLAMQVNSDGKTVNLFISYSSPKLLRDHPAT